MTNTDFSIILTVPQTPKEVFAAINAIRSWWSEDFSGTSEKLHDVFEVRFAGMHYSQQQLTELIPDTKIVWLVTDSKLNFLKNKSEWTGTKIMFEISEKNHQTDIHFTHYGLVPQIECFGDCTKGWTYYLTESLLSFITTGKGNPNVVK